MGKRKLTEYAILSLMLTKKFQITVGVLGGALILGLGAYGASLKQENNYLKLHPMVVKIVETATPTSTPSATPTFFYRRVTIAPTKTTK